MPAAIHGADDGAVTLVALGTELALTLALGGTGTGSGCVSRHLASRKAFSCASTGPGFVIWSHMGEAGQASRKF